MYRKLSITKAKVYRGNLFGEKGSPEICMEHRCNHSIFQFVGWNSDNLYKLPFLERSFLSLFECEPWPVDLAHLLKPTLVLPMQLCAKELLRVKVLILLESIIGRCLEWSGTDTCSALCCSFPIKRRSLQSGQLPLPPGKSRVSTRFGLHVPHPTRISFSCSAPTSEQRCHRPQHQNGSIPSPCGFPSGTADRMFPHLFFTFSTAMQ